MRVARVAVGVIAAPVLLLVPRDLPAETAQYLVRFESTWSSATHPTDFPPNAHLSGLIGGTHDDRVAFWSLGTLASPGIKDMAELGDKSALTLEVEAAIAAGTARNVLSGGGISPSPGVVTLGFTVSDSFPLVTLVSMVAPSPDWFVGVSGLSLRDGAGWIPHRVVDLDVHDAGTDSGPAYTSPNQATAPPVPVTLLASGPFASSSRIGTYTFDRVDVLGVPAVASAGSRLLLLGPNPVRESTRFLFQVPEGRTGELSVFAVDGRRVRTLHRGGTSGPAVVPWDARDDSGVRLAPGMYLAALRIAGLPTHVVRVLLVR
jgi:hypothetical protein